MDKRSLLALVLSMFVIMAWLMFFGPQQPQQPDVGQETTTTVNATSAEQTAVDKTPAAVAATVPAPVGVVVPREIVKVDTPLYTAEFSSLGGTVTKWALKEYKDAEGNGVDLLRDGGAYTALALGWHDNFSVSRNNFTVSGSDLVIDEGNPTGTLVFTYSDDVYSIKRTYTFHHDSYVVDIKDEVAGIPAYQITLGGDFILHRKADRYSHVGPVLLVGTDLESINTEKFKEAKLFPGVDTKWIALEDKYFCAALVPRKPMQDAKVWKVQDMAAVSLKSEPGVHEFALYAGPKRHEDLVAAGGGLEHIVDFGFFAIIAKPIFWLLKHIHSLIGNWGWAIVILTLIVRAPFIPIVNKGQRSMKKMQEVQPLMQKVKEQYKNDPKRMQAEMMNIYKKHKVNPMGGCLPMLIQLPVFFALYKVLLVAIELRGAPWEFWIHDLSMGDPYYILTIIMGITMFIQQKMTPTGGDPKQQKMMMLMPVVMTVMFIVWDFPSGLVLYWLTNNLLSIGQQIFVNKKKAAAEAA